LGGSKWRFGNDRILAAIELGASLFPEIRGIRETGYNLDSLTEEQLKRITDDIIQPYITKNLSISVNNKPHPVKVYKTVLEGTLWRIWVSVDDAGFDLPENRVKIDYRLLFEETNNAHVNIAYMYSSDAAADEVQKVFDYSHPAAHNSFDANAHVWELTIQGVALQPANGTPGAATSTGPKNVQEGHPPTRPAPKKIAVSAPASRMSPVGTSAPENKSPGADISQFIKLGVEHILIGYDHIVFLLALIVIGLSTREVLKIITAFTVAHSITLLLAALQIVSLNSRFVEIVIALSICYVALENLFKKEVRYRWLITFGFGLIHGFGFAGFLQGLIVGKSDMVIAVLSFNVGVEIGQLMIFLVLLPVLHLLKSRFEFRKISAGASVAVFILGLTWVIERTLDMRLLSF
jgi:hydrogenase/urease accessory protein HupE